MVDVELELPRTLLMSYLERAQEAHARGDRTAAARSYARALAIDPDCVGALNNLAMILAEERFWAAADACSRRAAVQSDGETLMWANHAAILIRHEEYEEAAKIFERLVEVHSEEPRFWQDLGLAYTPTDVTKALSCLKRSVELAPGTPWLLQNLGLAHLMVREWDVGFAMWRRSGLDTQTDEAFTAFQEWKGEPLEGKTVIVYHEQGLGDTIQFCRFLRLLEAERVVLAVPAALVRLMEMANVADEVVDFAAPAPSDVDYQVPLMFAWAYRSISDALAETRVPYLIAPERGPRVSRGAHTILTVGVCWAGNPVYGTDNLRSMPFERLIPLASIPGVQIVSLQKGDRAADVVANGCGALVQDVSGQIGDLADVAHIISQLDMVVSVDTAPLHLAGALGKPTVAMLPYNRCWRWGRDTAETPFYSTMKLVTQRLPGDWRGVVQEVRAVIDEMVGDRTVPSEPQTEFRELRVRAKEY